MDTTTDWRGSRGTDQAIVTIPLTSADGSWYALGRANDLNPRNTHEVLGVTAVMDFLVTSCKNNYTLLSIFLPCALVTVLPVCPSRWHTRCTSIWPFLAKIEGSFDLVERWLCCSVVIRLLRPFSCLWTTLLTVHVFHFMFARILGSPLMILSNLFALTGICTSRREGCQVCNCGCFAVSHLDLITDRTLQNYDFPNNCEDYIHRIGRTGVCIGL